MRILFFIDRFVPEDRANAQLYYELARELVKKGGEVGVVTKMPTAGYVSSEGRRPEEMCPPTRERLDGIDVIRVGGFSSLSRVLMVRAADHLISGFTFALGALKWQRADLLLIYSPPLPLALAGWIYQKWTGARYVLNVHDIYPQTLVDLGLLKNKIMIRLAEALEAMAYRNAARIVVPGPWRRDFLISRRGIDSRKIDWIPNWVDTDRIFPGPKRNGFRKAHGLSDRFIVSYAGSMGFGQDLGSVIASARVLQQRNDIVFLLVGDGVCRSKWEQMAAGLGNVRFLPMQPKEQFFEILRASDVCLVPLAEALNSPAIPGKAHHIMGVGRPLIAIVHPEGPTAELVTTSQCGFVVPPGQPDEVVRIINRFYEDGELGNKLGANGREYAERHFSLRRAVDGYERIFQAVLQQR